MIAQSMEAHAEAARRGVLAGLAEPRRGAVGLPAGGVGAACSWTVGPGVLARLRDEEGWPRVDAIAITHFHLDHWGDLVPWVWGRCSGSGTTCLASSCWLSPTGAEQLVEFGEAPRLARHVRAGFDLREYAEGEPFTAAGFEVLPLRFPHYMLLDVWVPRHERRQTLAYSGDSGPSDAARRAGARRGSLPLRGDAADAPNPGRASRAGTCLLDEAHRGVRRVGREAAPDHAPPARAAARTTASSSPTTASTVEI